MGKEVHTMKHRISTILGSFEVWMSYQPSADDEVLLRLTNCINETSLPLISQGNTPEECLQLLDEFDLEKKLFASLQEGRGSAQRLTLSLKEKKIEFQSF